MIKRALIGGVVAGLIAVAGLASRCVGGAQQDRLVKADVAGSTTWWGQIPIMVAIDKGFFKDAGLDVTLRPIIASSDRMAAVASGSVVFSNLGRIAVISQHGTRRYQLLVFCQYRRLAGQRRLLGAARLYLACSN